jgi:hypothetical protein
MSPSPQRSRFLLSGSIVAGLLGSALHAPVATAQTTVPENVAPGTAEEADDSGGLFSGGLLPNGSILKNVTLPSYDAQLRLLSTVNAGDLTIFTRDEPGVDKKTGKPKIVPVLDKVKINQLRIRFFNLDRSPKGNIAMSRAVLEVRKKITLLTSEEPVSFVSDDLKVDGTALAFDTKNNRGFLHGPVTAVAKTIDKRTSMNASPAQRALAASAMMMAAASAQVPAPVLPEGAPPETSQTSAQRFDRSRLTKAELDQLAADTASRAPQQIAASTIADKDLSEVKAKSEDGRLTMNHFLQAAALASMLADAAPAALPDVPRPPVFNDPKETVVKAKNGAYFDSDEGLLIFLGDVTVKNPELDLSGASEVKIFMEPEKKEEAAAVDPNAPPKPPPTPEQLQKMREAKDKLNQPLTPEQIEKMKQGKAAKLAEGLMAAAGNDKGEQGGKFGDVKRMVATGPAVRIRYSSGKPGSAPVEASAHTVVYDFEKHQILLQGGSPWVYQEGDDGMKGQAHGTNAYILVYTDDDGNLTKVLFENQGGGAEFNVKTPEKNEKKNDKPKQENKPKQEQPNR